jgi:ABC-type sugar transport system ATPase subunit
MDHPIQVESLRKSYGDFAALKGIDVEARAGEVFGLLGPNGAALRLTRFPDAFFAGELQLGDDQCNNGAKCQRNA